MYCSCHSAVGDDAGHPTSAILLSRKLRKLPSLLPVQSPRTSLALLPACRTCGVVLSEYRRVYCANCAVEQRRSAAPMLQVAGPAALARLREEGRDPSHGGSARLKRAAKVALRHRESASWPRTWEQIAKDRETFRRELLPQLRHLDLRKLVDATELSKPQCSMIKRGLQVRLVRDRIALKELAWIRANDPQIRVSRDVAVAPRSLTAYRSDEPPGYDLAQFRRSGRRCRRR